jgi:hypothetical protein
MFENHTIRFGYVDGIRVDGLANNAELSMWFDSIIGLMHVKKGVNVEDKATLKSYKLDYQYMKNEHNFLALQGYTLCFNLYDRNESNQRNVRYPTVKKDLIGKVTRLTYKYNKKANHGNGAFCQAVFMN